MKDYFLLYLKKIRGEKFSCSYLSVIEAFYNNHLQSRQKIKISFENFYRFYQEQLRQIILKTVKYSKRSPIRIDRAKNSKNFYFMYKYIELDKNVLANYIYLLSNKSKTDLYYVFPYYALKDNLKLPIFRFNEVSDSVETSIINLKLLKSNDLTCLSCLLAFGFTSKENSNNQLLIIPFIQNSITDSFFYRRYVSLFLNIFLKIAEEKKAKGEEISFEYGLFLFCFNVLQRRKIFFTEELRMTIQEFKSLQSYKDSFKEKTLINPLGSFPFEFNIIKTGGECRCKDKNFQKEIQKYIKVFRDNSEFIGRLVYKCSNPKCQRETHPKIQLNQKYTTPLFSPKKLYTECVKIMSDFKKNLTLSLDVKSYKKILINLIYYLDQFGFRQEIKDYFMNIITKLPN